MHNSHRHPDKTKPSFPGWLIPAGLIGLVVGVAGVMSGMPERRFTPFLWTSALIYAVLSSFQRLWRRPLFWLLFLVLFALHFILLWKLSKQDFGFLYHPSLRIALIEVITMMAVLMGVFGLKAAD